MKNYVKTILFYLLLIGVVILLVAAIFRNTKQEKLVFSDMVGYFKEDRVVSFVIDEKFNVNLKVIKTTGDGALQADADGKWVTEEVSYKLRSLQLFEDYCGEYVANNANLQSYEIEPETTYPWWVSLLPYLFILLLGVGLVVFFVLRSPVIFPAAVRKNHFTVYQNSSLARAGMVSDTFLKEKRKRKKKVASKARRGSDEMVSHSRRASPLTKA